MNSNAITNWQSTSTPSTPPSTIYSQQTGNVQDRNASDKSALEAKIARKAKQKQEEEAAAALATTKVVRKKGAGVKKVDEGLDDLLSAGLNKSKKKK